MKDTEPSDRLWLQMTPDQEKIIGRERGSRAGKKGFE
jgi:hypothetical protein